MLLNFWFIPASVFFIWLIVLTVWLMRSSSHYNELTRGVNNKNLRNILENMLKEFDIAKGDISDLKKYCEKNERDGIFHIQKIGLKRFNPFKDTGGDQSFVLALVDGNDTGVVISGLYSRSGTRWYAKKVSFGKGVDYELSDEEKSAIKEARLGEASRRS
ncbi:MAG: hypothetical protein A2W22_06540 [Candidatus Levybacteria bacterium RBG_16_35_11]|nr:MAG: hypothetical protein A2W22_06540 [Candidatus Levybacteria bacterium RBG_16_35_11]